VSPLNEYFLVRALIGTVAMSAIVSTGLVFFMLSGFSKKWKRILILQLAGAILIALGFSVINLKLPDDKSISIILITTGLVAMGSSFFKKLPTKFPKFLLFQGTLILTSPIVTYLSSGIIFMSVLRAFVLLSLLIMMETLMLIGMRSAHTYFTLNIASWLMALYSWIGNFCHSLPTCYAYVLLLVYYTSLLLWLFGAITTLINLRGWLGWSA